MFRRVQDWLPIVIVVAMVTGAVVWQNQREEESQPERHARCQRLSGSVEGRVRACLEDLGRSELSAQAKEVVADIAADGKVMALADLDVKSKVGLGSDPAIEPLLMGLDEHALAKKLRDTGVRGVVVSRDLIGAVDRDTTVLARLAHHDFLEWF